MTKGSHSTGEETINPLSGLDVYNTIEFVGADDLWVQVLVGGLDSSHVLGLLESSPGGRFSSTWWSHNEDTMSNGEQFLKLDDL